MRPARAAALLAVLAALSLPALADNYHAIGNTAMSITGDIAFDDFGITFADGKSLRFAELIGDSFTVAGEEVPASVDSVAKPSDPKLLNGNRLCGSGPVTYVASWGKQEDELAAVVAVFTGDDPPESDETACATYLYELAQ